MGSGIVTTDAVPFTVMVDRVAPAMTELALECRLLILGALPGTIEVVWDGQGTAGYGTGPKKMTEQFCWIAPAKNHVTMGFYYGAELPDPTNLLEGTGKLMRHVKVRNSTQLETGELRALIRRATTHRVPRLAQ